MSAPTATNLKQELLELEKQNWEAWKARDGATMRTFLDDRYIMTMEEGITDQDSKTFVEDMLGSDMKLKSYKFDTSSAVAREIAPGVAVIAYKAHPEMTQGKKTLATDYFFSTTFVKKGDRWVAAAGSASRSEPTK